MYIKYLFNLSSHWQVVDVVPVNDERPVVVENRGISLEIGATKVCER